jgi:hypothetical protein
MQADALDVEHRLCGVLVGFGDSGGGHCLVPLFLGAARPDVVPRLPVA